MSLASLISYGAQDVYLTGQPQISFFKSIYQRFSEYKNDITDPNIGINFGKPASIKINRNGDLYTPVYLNVSLTTPSLESSEYICPKLESDSYFTENIEDSFDPTLFNIPHNAPMIVHYYHDLQNMKDIADTIIVEI